MKIQSIINIAEENLPSKFKEYLDNFIENCRGLNRSLHTLINYRADLQKFLIWLYHQKKLNIHKITGATISEYQEFLKVGGEIYKKTHFFYFWKKNKNNDELLFISPPLSVGSRRRHLSTIKNFFEYLKQTHEDRTIKVFAINPVKSKLHAITLKDKDVENTTILKESDYLTLNETLWRFDDRLMIELLYYGGLRLEELSNLKYECFNFYDKSITFIRKGGSRHTLYIDNSDKIFRDIKNKSYKNANDFLFTNKWGMPLSKKTLYNRIMKFFKKAYLSPKLSPHSFRKGCATRLYLKTRDLLFVRDYLNHADAKVTQTYIDKGVLNEDYQRQKIY